MLDYIGVLIGFAVLLTLAAAGSAIFAVLTRLLTRKCNAAPRRFLIGTALILPLASAVYYWLCIAILPGNSVFGDISEPLPNRYVVEALGKMPDFAGIKDPESPWRYPHLSECIGKLAVDGQLVIGQYSHPCDTFMPKPNESYFIFDAQRGIVTELPTQSALQSRLGHPVTLYEVQLFRSPLARGRRRFNKIIQFGPPITALLLLTWAILRCRMRSVSNSRNIYT